MSVREIKKDIYWVGSIDWDRTLFDELIPLPDGTSYNSYVVIGSEKTALIDTVEPAKVSELISNLDKLDIKNIDYIVANHAEQDHSGSIGNILTKYPNAKVITNQKCKDMLIDLLLIPEDKFEVISDGQKVSLGNKTLAFTLTPWVHWPETMITYLEEDGVLFSCDFFGSHFATSELFVSDECKVYESAKRYFAEIMMPFRNNIKNHLQKIDNLNIQIIAPSHGQVYGDPNFIINAYKEWISDDVKNEVAIIYASMHGSTEKMVNHFVDELISTGIKVRVFNITKADIGEIAMALVDAATLIVASPTVLAGAHPHIIYATYLANALRPKTKFVSVIGSFGWGGKMVEHIAGLLTNIKPVIIEPVIIKGFPKEEDFNKLSEFAKLINEKHKQIGLA